uniref:Uncharacterized protein n=1 Tax=Avena sativa TaxID=4498 RepID=A0ACD5UGI1_AVESA
MGWPAHLLQTTSSSPMTTALATPSVQVFVFVTTEYENSKNALNQVSLWDRVIPDKDHANVQVEVKSKYPLIDQGSSLRGKKVQLVLHWHVMPNAGRMMRGKMPLSEFSLPDTYTS